MYLRPLLSVSTVFWQKVTKLFGQLSSALPSHAAARYSLSRGGERLSSRKNSPQKPGRLSSYQTLAGLSAAARSRKFVLLPLPARPPLPPPSPMHYNHHARLLLRSIDIFPPLFHKRIKNPVAKYRVQKIDLKTFTRARVILYTKCRREFKINTK